MVKYKEDGDNFSSVFGSTRTCYREINKNEYHRLLMLSPDQLNDEVESSLDQSIICGYGYYGASLVVRDDKFYVVYRRGISCD